MTVEYLIVGAGFSALSAARALQHAGVEDLLILEEGKLNSRRVCPGASAGTCVYCRRGCDITSGVGGANALHGNKVCYFPASEGITHGRSSEERRRALRTVDEMLSPLTRFAGPGLKPEEPGRKHYYSDVLSANHFRELASNLSAPLLSSGTLVANARVESISRSGGCFQVRTRTESFSAQHVLWATGRRAAKSSHQVYSALGVSFRHPRPDFGIRVKAPVESFSSAYYYQTDPKFKFAFDDGVIARTFCAHNRGEVVPVLIDKGFYADGAFGEAFGETNNIALMIRDPAPFTTAEVDAWCARLNQISNGRLRQVFDQTGSANTTTLRDIREALYAFAEILPSVRLRYRWKPFIDELVDGQAGIFSQNATLQQFEVYAPAVDKYWPEPEINADFETSCSGFYVVGDAAGSSRGFYQAMIAGALWAQRRLNPDISNFPCSTSELPVSL